MKIMLLIKYGKIMQLICVSYPHWIITSLEWSDKGIYSRNHPGILAQEQTMDSCEFFLWSYVYFDYLAFCSHNSWLDITRLTKIDRGCLFWSTCSSFCWTHQNYTITSLSALIQFYFYTLILIVWLCSLSNVCLAWFDEIDSYPRCLHDQEWSVFFASKRKHPLMV